ncbi:MAG: hypothetical protein LBR25_06230 [Erysipelotrichaceae bacterium]|jgi:hypothetical protein|nr:hypothetical protein [Erysipelotrichaceae bacterium]
MTSLSLRVTDQNFVLDRPRIPVDFSQINGVFVPLTPVDAVLDSEGTLIVLKEELEVYLHQVEYDVFDRRNDLVADGFVVKNPQPNSPIKWCAVLDFNGIRRYSDLPGMSLSPLNAHQKRKIIHQKIEGWISLLGQKDGHLIQSVVSEYLKILDGIEDE